MLKEKKDLLVFGYGLGLMSAILGVGGWFKHGFGLPVLVLVLCSLIFVSITAMDWTALKPGYRAWMKVAHLIGRVVTTVILTIIFFIIFTPVSLVLKLMGRDHLQRDFSKKAKTYWEKRPQTVFQKEQYQLQF